jgi:hypothetical protein
MRTRLLPGLLALTLAGCASSAQPPRAVAHQGTSPGGTSPMATTPPAAYDVAPRTAARGPSGGDWAVSIVGTPFLLVFRSVVCAGSLVVAAPFSAIFALADAPDGLQALGDGVSQNCAGPYILRPSDLS